MANLQLHSDLVSQKFSEKRHHARSTQKESFRIVTEDGTRSRQKAIILNTILKHQPVTSRKLAELTGQERTSVTRSLYDLLHEDRPEIKEALTDRCPTTGKRVIWYSMFYWNPEQKEQLKLFE